MKPKEKTILIIEDNETNMFLFKETLGMAGFHNILCADNGWDGIQLLFKNQPDLLILDVALPDMTTAEVQSEIKKHPESNKIKILVVTASLTKKQKEKFSKEFIHFMLKPINIEKFTEKVKQLLED